MTEYRMTSAEWNALIAKIRGCFPAMPRDDAALSAAWYSELKHFTPEQVFAAVKSLAMREKSAFAPSVFQIEAELKELLRPRQPQPTDLWETVLKLSGQEFSRERFDALPAQAKAALKAIGGLSKLGYTNETQLPFVKREFVAACKDAAERLDREEFQKALPMPNRLKALTGKVG